VSAAPFGIRAVTREAYRRLQLRFDRMSSPPRCWSACSAGLTMPSIPSSLYQIPATARSPLRPCGLGAKGWRHLRFMLLSRHEPVPDPRRALHVARPGTAAAARSRDLGISRPARLRRPLTWCLGSLLAVLGYQISSLMGITPKL